MTGITTTPHLHFQMDREIAPSHPYWPFTFRDAQDIGVDFFAAVNVGLGKENALKNTLHPMEFVQGNASYVAAATVSVPRAVEVASASPAETVPAAPETESEPKNAAPPETAAVQPEPVVQPVSAPVAEPAAPVETKAPKTFDSPVDVRTSNASYAAIKAALDSGMFRLSDDGRFSPAQKVTRRDAVLAFSKLLSTVPSEFPDLPFSDVLPSDPVAGVLARFVESGFVGAADRFRPNDAITRAEAAIILARISGVSPIQGKPAFRDLKAADGRTAALNGFAAALRLRRGVVFGLETPLTRSEFAKMVDTWRKKTGNLR